MKNLEKIGPYEVHPVASIFPMMTPKESLELGMSIADIGLQEPVVVHEGLLVDGRNRVKECMACGVPVRTVEWSKIVAHNPQHTGRGGIDDLPATTVDQWIMAKNIARRSLTPDQIAAVWTQHGLWEEAEDAKKRQAKAAFKSDDERRSPGGKPVVNLDSGQPQQAKDYHQTSTVGRIAQKANVSRHKAEQAVKLVKAVESGTAPAEDLELVKAGLKKLNDAVKPLKKDKPDKPKPDLESVVLKLLQRLMDKCAVADHPKVRSILIAALTENRAATPSQHSRQAVTDGSGGRFA